MSPSTDNAFLSALEAEDFARIRPDLTHLHLEAGAVVFEPDQPVDFVYFPTSAVLSVITVMGDGRAVETATVGSEGVVGLLPALGGTRSLSQTVVQISGDVQRLPVAGFRQLAFSSPSLRDLVVCHALLNTAQAQQSVACNALHDLVSRLARWLLLSQDRTRSRVIRLTQEYLAIMLGVQRTTVTMAARTLQDAGLIEYSRGAIRILDRPGLERAACECYAAGRETMMRLFSSMKSPHRAHYHDGGGSGGQEAPSA